jgi:hypothetical protein
MLKQLAVTLFATALIAPTHAIDTACLPWQAPIGHRQPRVADIGIFRPTPSDLELQDLDKVIDQKLTICRGC